MNTPNAEVTTPNIVATSSRRGACSTSIISPPSRVCFGSSASSSQNRLGIGRILGRVVLGFLRTVWLTCNSIQDELEFCIHWLDRMSSASHMFVSLYLILHFYDRRVPKHPEEVVCLNLLNLLFPEMS